MSDSARIPVIDISAPDADESAVAAALVEAAIDHGFVYIRNAGRDIPVKDVERAFDLSRDIFALPASDKAPCSIQTNNRGWSGMHVETLDPKNQRVGDYKEAFNFGEFKKGQPQQPLPKAIEPSQAEIGTFFDQCYHLCLKLNHLLGIGLGVTPPTFFQEAHLRERGPSGNTLRFLYYPPLAATDARPNDVRAGAHSDYGSITLLFRLAGQPGLEIQTGTANSWAPVPVSPPGTEADPAPPILVNVGDLLSYWTNGLLRSTVHRVVFPAPGTAAEASGKAAEPRYSIAFFCHPVGTCALEPVPSERVRQHARPQGADTGNPYAERTVMTADEHLQMRLKASYGKLYEEEGKA